MLFDGRRESDNVEDQRGGGGLLVKGGIGTAVIALIIYLLGGNPSAILNNNAPATQQGPPATESAAEKSEASFTKVVLADTEDTWGRLFSGMGKQYEQPHLVMFRDQVESACGFAQAAMGPFYCPDDHKVYIDLSFFDLMQNRFHERGNFAMAYVIAHEVGHHVQQLLGYANAISERQNLSGQGNVKSVRLELQADFLAGVWAHYEQNLKTADGHNVMEASDIPAALHAASQIGDDKLQEQSQGRVVPDAFTHGTSAQREYWFSKGFRTGDVRAGDSLVTADRIP